MKANKANRSMTERRNERHSSSLQTVTCLALALLILLSSLTIMPGTASAGIFENVGGPDATFRDVMWNNDGTNAYVVGNDSASNGVAYEYTASNQTWDQLASVPGDSYNAISKTNAFGWVDGAESGENGWTANTWGGEAVDTLAGEWKFEDGVGTTANDTSGNEHDGILTNMDPATDWVDGISGKALDFDGIDDYVSVPDAAGLTDGGSFTGQCWVNISTHEVYRGIVNKYSSGGWGIWDQADGGIRFYRNDGATSNSNDATPISTNEWHHIAWSYNASSGFASFYIDGNLDYSVPSVNPLRTVTPMTIGKYGGSYYLDGQIDEVQIYNRALTPKEISDYYNETMNKVGEWKFDEGAGTIAVDTSQHDNNGTLNFMAASDWVDGVSGKALYFDGANKFVDCGNDSSLDLPLEFTIEAWVNTATTGQFQTVVSKAITNSATGISYAYLLNIDNRLILYLGDGTTTESQYSTTPLAVNTWNHIAVVATDTQLLFYLNGQPDGVFAHTMTPQVIDSNVRIGTKSMSPTQYFNGNIDEVNIWNYSLSSSDILDNYNEGRDYYLQEQTKMGDWKFDEGANGIAYDDSQYERDGTLGPTYPTNAPVWTSGMSGSALSFDGDDYVDVDYIPNTFNIHNHSIQAWIYPTANVTDGVIYAVGESASNYKNLEFKLGNGMIEVWHWGDNWLTGVYAEMNEWTHVVYTYDSSIKTAYIYVDGEYGGSYTYADYLSINSDANIPSQIGHGYSLRYFVGNLDEVKIWNRMLNATEISESYSNFMMPDWQIIDPATLPIPTSGVDHGSAKSGSNIWWFGNNNTGDYDAGARVTGSLVSPVTYLPSTSTMGVVAFSHWFDVEPGNPGVDMMSISIKNTTDLTWTQLKYWDSNSAPVSSWYQEIIDVTGWLGNDVQMNFTFDSADGNNNDYSGWHIDDVIFYTNDVYIVVGDIPSGAGHSAYSMDNYGNMKNITGMNTINFNDVAGGNIPATFVAVGDAGQARYWDGGSWVTLLGMGAGDTLTGIDFNGTHFFIVGYDNGNNGVAYYITESELDAGSFTLHTIAGTPTVRLNAIEWHNNVAGGLVCAEGAIYFLNSAWTWIGPIGVDASVNYTAASWDIQGSRAIIVGNTASGSAAYDIYAGKTEITQIPDYDNIFQSHKLYGAAYQPTASGNVEVMLVGASAFKIMPKAFDQNTQILVEADYPSIFDVQFYETSNPGPSRLNLPNDVDDTYTFYTEVNYSSAGGDKLFDGINNTAIDIIAWYDDDGASEFAIPAEDAEHRTRMFNATWYEGDGGGSPQNAILNYPIASPGTNEFQIMGFSSVALGGDHWGIEVEIYFGFQTRAADGNSFGNGASSDVSDPTVSFNDADSWNFMVNIYDMSFPAASNISYEEFGIFKYTNITVSGNPGGNVPPGSNDNPIGNSLITYSANVAHYVNVSIPDLARVGGGGSIPATNFAVNLAGILPAGFDYDPYTEMNTSWGPYGLAFAGANVERMVWGNGSRPLALQLIPVPDNGTTAYGPWGSDYNGYGATQIAWWASVPGATPEGEYQASITIKIGYY